MDDERFDDDAFEDIEDVGAVDDLGDLDEGYEGEAVYDAGVEHETAGPGELFGTPARAITLGVAILVLFLLTGTIAWLLGSRANAGGQVGGTAPPGSATLVTAPRVGALAPDFTLTDADTGKPIRLSSLRGKPVWINFWASWCHACVVEMPDMKKVYDRNKDKGLVILGLDDMESQSDVNDFTRTYGYDWTFLLDPDGATLTTYRVEAIPTHWFVGRDGVIKAVQVGALPQDAISDLVAKITE